MFIFAIMLNYNVFYILLEKKHMKHTMFVYSVTKNKHVSCTCTCTYSLAYLGCESLVLKHLMDQLEERILQTDQLKKAFVVSC